MKILFGVDPEIPVPPTLYGGIERIVDGLIAELRGRGHQVGLLAHPDSNAHTDYFRDWPGKRSEGLLNEFRNTVTLSRAVRTFKPDVIHSFSRLIYLSLLLPTKLPKVMSYQRHTGGPRIRIAAKVAGRSLAFTACSNFIAEQGRPWGGTWEVIPNFVETQHYNPSFSVAADAPLVFLSRIERIKGTHTAIEIARRAGRKLIIAGNKVEMGDGPAYWRNEVEPHIDGDNVEYIGPVNDSQKIELLRRAAALVVPVQWDEPFGIVFIEALACGTPIVSCPRGALLEVVRNGKEGFLVQSVEEGISVIDKIETLSRAKCRERVEQVFSRPVVVSQYESLYRRLIATKTAEL